MDGSSDIIRVYLVTGSAKSVRYDERTTVERVLHVLLAGLDIERICYGHFALRLVSYPVTECRDCFWLPPILNMRQVRNKYLTNAHAVSQFRFELRIRFVPVDLDELRRAGTTAFMYLYAQLHNDFVHRVAWKLDVETAVDIGCIHIRRLIGDPPGGRHCSGSIEKSINFHQLEEDYTKYFPEAVIVNTKPKTLRKLIVQGVKKVAALSDTECIFVFFESLMAIARYDIEIFKASLGAGWLMPAEVIIGQKIGIAYMTDTRCAPHTMSDLIDVVEIRIRPLHGDEARQTTVVEIRLSANPQPLLITCPTTNIAESLAHLVDGYQMLLSQQNSVCTISDLINDSSSPPRSPCRTSYPNHNNNNNTRFLIDEDGDEDRDLQLDRRRVTLEELLGDGQFGNVYRGFYESPEDGVVHSVAVKACKMDVNSADELNGDRHNFLDEAYVMRQFHHPHIVQLIGICLESPPWIILELAPLGELRSFLVRQRPVLTLSDLLLFCGQLSSAVCYLHARSYIHRDLAARNVLVSTPTCVKLSDFGLSRSLDDENVYTASHGKLPIKWMAPESINFRRFSTATDVWMFGVCIWEILMFGVKPWQGVRNHEVINKLEAEERLTRPPGCPKALYTLLLMMWALNYRDRISIVFVKEAISEFIRQIDRGVECERLTLLSRSAWDLQFGEDSVSPPPQQLHDRNRVLSSVPMLKMESTSALPAATLLKTLEDQRLQGEEDDRWIEEQEQLLLPECSLPEPRRNSVAFQLPNNHSHDDDPSTPGLHSVVVRVVHALSLLAKCHTDPSNERFLTLVKEITSELKKLFAHSQAMQQRIEDGERQRVKAAETMIAEEMRNMADMVRAVLNASNDQLSPDEENNQQEKILRVTNTLAEKCHHFLDVIDFPRHRSRMPPDTKTL